MFGLLDQADDGGLLAKRVLHQAGAVEGHVEAAEGVAVAERLEGVVLVLAGGGGAVVKAEGDEVGDDAEAAVPAQGVEVVPALGDGGAAVGAVAVEVDAGALELNHHSNGRGDGGAGREFAEDGVGVAGVEDVLFLAEEVGLIGFGLGQRGVAEGLAQDFFAERALELGFVRGGELARRIRGRPT